MQMLDAAVASRMSAFHPLRALVDGRISSDQQGFDYRLGRPTMIRSLFRPRRRPVLLFLQQVIEDCEGGAPVSVLLANYKSYNPMILYAVDEIGMVVSDARTLGRKMAYPWSAVAAVKPEIE